MLCRSAIVGIAFLAVVLAQSNEELLPPGPAKDKLVKLCVGCHEIDLVVARRHTKPEWEGVMEDMIARGSKGTPEELAALADYLNQNLGKVNVNAATAKELEQALKIPAADARAIVGWREQHCRFSNFEEVRKVPGLDQSKIRDKRWWMSFE
jgi:competence ComEA-like helix-hairpin-helix protein